MMQQTGLATKPLFLAQIVTKQPVGKRAHRSGQRAMDSDRVEINRNQGDAQAQNSPNTARVSGVQIISNQPLPPKTLMDMMNMVLSLFGTTQFQSIKGVQLNAFKPSAVKANAISNTKMERVNDVAKAPALSLLG